MKRAIVSLANNKGNYVKALSRLSKSLDGDNNADFFGFIGEHSVGAPLHTDVPYGFKVLSIDYVRSLGYSQVLWVDSSLWAIKNTFPIWEHLDVNGYFLHEAGHSVGTWCNDFTLNYFGISRDDAMKMYMFTGGFFGLNFDFEISRKFYAQYKNSMLAGCFNGAWDNKLKTESQDERCEGHRHDMTCGSIIANKLNMTYLSGNEWMQYSAPYKVPNNETIIFYAQGM